MCTSDTWLCPPLVTNPQGKLEGLTKGERNRDCGCSVRTPQQASKKPLEDKKASHSRPHRPRQRETSRKTCFGSTCILSRPPHLQRSLAACHFLLRITKQASKTARHNEPEKSTVGTKGRPFLGCEWQEQDPGALHVHCLIFNGDMGPTQRNELSAFAKPTHIRPQTPCRVWGRDLSQAEARVHFRHLALPTPGHEPPRQT